MNSMTEREPGQQDQQPRYESFSGMEYAGDPDAAVATARNYLHAAAEHAQGLYRALEAAQAAIAGASYTGPDLDLDSEER